MENTEIDMGTDAETGTGSVGIDIDAGLARCEARLSESKARIRSLEERGSRFAAEIAEAVADEKKLQSRVLDEMRTLKAAKAAAPAPPAGGG